MTKLETGYSYKYTPEKDREDRDELRDRTCCGCGESSMERSDKTNTIKCFQLNYESKKELLVKLNFGVSYSKDQKTVHGQK